MMKSTAFKSSKLYLYFIALCGTSLLFNHFAWPQINNSSDWVLLIIFIITILLLNEFIIILPNRENGLSMDSSIYLATIFIFGLEFTLVILIVSSIFYGFYKYKYALWKHIINLAIYSIMMCTTYFVFTFAGGEPGYFSVNNILAYLLASMCYYIVNVLIMGAYYYFDSSVSLLSIYTEFLESFPNYLITLALAPILMILLELYPISGLLLFTFIIVLLSLAFRKYHFLYKEISNDKTYREQILNSLPVGIITVNDITSDYYLNTSASRLLDMDRDEIKSLITNQNPPSSNLHFWELISSKRNSQSVKTAYNTSSEKVHHLVVSNSELMDQNNNPIGRIHHFMDITEIEELEKRIYQSEKLALLGEISARAAHEIRNPLTVIHGFLTLMTRNITKDDKERFHIPLLLKELERINTIIQEMLLIAKPGDPSLKEAYLEDIINEVLPLYHQYSPAIEIQFKVELERVPLLLDTKQMTQVIYNLVRNSVEAIDIKGNISFHSRIQNNSYQFFIEDSGTGIPGNFQETIFNAFLTSKESGTGLGLTIVQRIIENHQGSIELYSSSETGTIFLITLPLLNKE